MDKVAIVEDNAAIRRLLEIRLRRAGLSVLSAEDGESGLRLIRAEKPRVVVLDSSMPGMSGLTLCQAIRTDPDQLGTFIIVASGSVHTDEVQKAKEFGADLYFPKPYNMDELVDKIHMALASTRAASAVKVEGGRGSIPTPGRTALS